jgi:hypothetical protein
MTQVDKYLLVSDAARAVTNQSQTDAPNTLALLATRRLVSTGFTWKIQWYTNLSYWPSPAPPPRLLYSHMLRPPSTVAGPLLSKRA